MRKELYDKFDVYLSQKLGPGFIDLLEELVCEINNSEITNNRIRYRYTDDEYGVAARRLHQEFGKLNRAYVGDAGIDLPIVLSEEQRKIGGGNDIWPGEREVLHTGIQMEFPVGYYARIVHRSSTEKKHRLRVIEGIIDDYRGEVLVQVHNPNTCQVKVHHGDRLGQLILSKTRPFEIEYSNDLRPSERGLNGFGSSGK